MKIIGRRNQKNSLSSSFKQKQKNPISDRLFGHERNLITVQI